MIYEHVHECKVRRSYMHCIKATQGNPGAEGTVRRRGDPLCALGKGGLARQSLPERG